MEKGHSLQVHLESLGWRISFVINHTLEMIDYKLILK